MLSCHYFYLHSTSGHAPAEEPKSASRGQKEVGGSGDCKPKDQDEGMAACNKPDGGRCSDFGSLRNAGPRSRQRSPRDDDSSGTNLVAQPGESAVDCIAYGHLEIVVAEFAVGVGVGRIYSGGSRQLHIEDYASEFTAAVMA